MNRLDLLPHQKQALNETEKFNKVAYFHDMGLGKTFTGSEKLRLLNEKTNIILCQKSKIYDWEEHFKRYYPKFKIFKINELEEFFDWIDYKVLIINYDLIFRRKILTKGEKFTLLLDESSEIQNHTSKRAKELLKSKHKNLILLSGTPTSGKYENLWTQCKLLGYDIKLEIFLKMYVNYKKLKTKNRILNVVDKQNPYKNIDRLKSKLREHGAVFLKTEEVINLPEQIFTTVKIKNTMEYNKFKKNSIITIDTLNLKEFKDDSDFYGIDITPRVELIGDTILNKRLYQKQMCTVYNKNKLQAFKDLMNSTNDRLIVFYCYNNELQKLIDITKKADRPISIINGKDKDLNCYEELDNSITFIQYQAGAMGLNLQKANKIVYYSFTERSELFEQSKKRTHRIGQTSTCFYYNLIVENSIEEDIYRCLEQKRDYTDYLFINECEV